MRRSIAVACALILALGGCVRNEEPARPRGTFEPQNTASSPSPKPTAKDSPACKFLTAKERRSIAGERIDVEVPIQPVEGTVQCRWVRRVDAAPTVLQVVAAPAQVWARGMPSQIQSALMSGQANDKTRDRLLSARKKLKAGAEKLSDKEACRMFSLMAEVNGRKKGTTEMVNFPRFNTQRSAYARTCAKGVFASVQYTELGLQPSTAVVQAVLRLMRIAHQRAVKEL